MDWTEDTMPRVGWQSHGLSWIKEEEPRAKRGGEKNRY